MRTRLHTALLRYCYTLLAPWLRRQLHSVLRGTCSLHRVEIYTHLLCQATDLHGNECGNWQSRNQNIRLFSRAWGHQTCDDLFSKFRSRDCLVYVLKHALCRIPILAHLALLINYSPLPLRVIIWLRNIICCLSFLMISIWFRYDFVMVSIWFWYGWKYVFLRSESLLSKGYDFRYGFSMVQNCLHNAKMFHFKHIAWNKEISTVLRLQKFATFCIIY